MDMSNYRGQNHIKFAREDYNHMITGKIKNQVDAIWMSFWTGGITNSIDVLEQMTYLFFMKMLDDAQLSP